MIFCIINVTFVYSSNVRMAILWAHSVFSRRESVADQSYRLTQEMTASQSTWVVLICFSDHSIAAASKRIPGRRTMRHEYPLGGGKS